MGSVEIARAEALFIAMLKIIILSLMGVMHAMEIAPALIKVAAGIALATRARLLTAPGNVIIPLM
jgi:hypothetical protein